MLFAAICPMIMLFLPYAIGMLLNNLNKHFGSKDILFQWQIAYNGIVNK